MAPVGLGLPKCPFIAERLTRIATEQIRSRGALHDGGEQLLQTKVSASMLFREFEDSSAAANHASQRIIGDDHR